VTFRRSIGPVKMPFVTDYPASLWTTPRPENHEMGGSGGRYGLVSSA
jgi:hypothetical protein